MANKVKVKMNGKSARELLNSAVVRDALKARADAIAAASGDGYEPSVQTGKNRARASVITGTPKAMRDNAKNNTLLKSLGQGAV